MCRWFQTGDLGIISGHLVIKEAKQEQQKLASWTAKYLRPKKLRLPEPQDPSLRKDGSTIWRSIVEKVKEEVIKKEAKEGMEEGNKVEENKNRNNNIEEGETPYDKAVEHARVTENQIKSQKMVDAVDFSNPDEEEDISSSGKAGSDTEEKIKQSSWDSLFKKETSSTARDGERSWVKELVKRRMAVRRRKEKKAKCKNKTLAKEKINGIQLKIIPFLNKKKREKGKETFEKTGEENPN